jgi:hypothetical protein
LKQTLTLSNLEELSSQNHNNIIIHDVEKIFQGHFKLSDLLPYDPSTKKEASLRTGLLEYQALLNALQEAIKKFHESELDRFDSLVGENACQIRAAFVAIFSSNETHIFSGTIHQLENVLKTVDYLLSERTINSLMSSAIDFEKILSLHVLDFSLTFQEMFLFQSFLLSEAMTIVRNVSLCGKDYATPSNLKKFGTISSSFAENLVRKARKLLSINSVRFTRGLAFTLKNPDLLRMVSEEFTVRHNNWLCLPMYWTYKIILLSIQKEEIPLVIHAKFIAENGNDTYKVVSEKGFLFHPQDYQKKPFQFSLVSSRNLPSESFEKPAFIVEGVVCVESNKEKDLYEKEWENKFLATSISDVILACAADHKQYPNSELDQRIHSLNNLEFINFSSFANKNGFSLNNPSTFFINHVYGSKLENFIDLLKNHSSNNSISIQNNKTR